MKKAGRQIIFFIVMFMVASITMLSAQAKSRDLQTELTKFWPDSTFRDQNVWQLYPVEISELIVYPDGDFVINAPLGGYAETFYVNSQSNGCVEFDSDIYKLTFDKSIPAVKGLIFSLTSKYHPKDTYIGIIFDDRVVKSNIGKKNKNKQEYDEMDVPIYKVSQVDFEKVNNRDKESRGTYDTGIPIIKYGKNNENDGIVSPNMVVKVFSIGHPIGDFMEGHKGQKITEVGVGALDQKLASMVKMVKEFQDDHIYPISIAFTFDNNEDSKEIYRIFKTKADDFVLINKSFCSDWQP